MSGQNYRETGLRLGQAVVLAFGLTSGAGVAPRPFLNSENRVAYAQVGDPVRNNLIDFQAPGVLFHPVTLTPERNMKIWSYGVALEKPRIPGADVKDSGEVGIVNLTGAGEVGLGVRTDARYLKDYKGKDGVRAAIWVGAGAFDTITLVDAQGGVHQVQADENGFAGLLLKDTSDRLEFSVQRAEGSNRAPVKVIFGNLSAADAEKPQHKSVLDLADLSKRGTSDGSMVDTQAAGSEVTIKNTFLDEESPRDEYFHPMTIGKQGEQVIWSWGYSLRIPSGWGQVLPTGELGQLKLTGEAVGFDLSTDPRYIKDYLGTDGERLAIWFKGQKADKLTLVDGNGTPLAETLVDATGFGGLILPEAAMTQEVQLGIRVNKQPGNTEPVIAHLSNISAADFANHKKAPHGSVIDGDNTARRLIPDFGTEHVPAGNVKTFAEAVAGEWFYAKNPNGEAWTPALTFALYPNPGVRFESVNTGEMLVRMDANAPYPANFGLRVNPQFIDHIQQGAQNRPGAWVRTQPGAVVVVNQGNVDGKVYDTTLAVVRADQNGFAGIILPTGSTEIGVQIYPFDKSIAFEHKVQFGPERPEDKDKALANKIDLQSGFAGGPFVRGQASTERPNANVARDSKFENAVAGTWFFGETTNGQKWPTALKFDIPKDVPGIKYESPEVGRVDIVSDGKATNTDLYWESHPELVRQYVTQGANNKAAAYIKTQPGALVQLLDKDRKVVEKNGKKAELRADERGLVAVLISTTTQEVSGFRLVYADASASSRTEVRFGQEEPGRIGLVPTIDPVQYR